MCLSPPPLPPGINIFLDGFVPTENLRFRDTSLIFKVAETADLEELKRLRRYHFPAMLKRLGEFELRVSPGEFTDSEIIVMLGENGTGKTTFIRLMAGLLKPDSGGEGGGGRREGWECEGREGRWERGGVGGGGGKVRGRLRVWGSKMLGD